MAELEDVGALLEEHGASVGALRSALGAGLPAYCDELWLLRYVLSESDVALAAENAKQAIAWRTEMKDLLEHARAGTVPGPYFEHIKRYMFADFHAKDSRHGSPLYCIRAGISNPRACMKKVTHEEVVNYLMYYREQMHIRCDTATRKTGKLVKVITCNDLSHVSLFVGQDKRMMRVLGEVSKRSEVVYPQLLLRAVMIHMPSVLYNVSALFKSFLSKKTQQKIALCPGTSAQGDITKCPFVRAHLDVDAVPSFLGGTCRCKQGCVPGCANEACKMVGEQDDDGKTTRVVAARDKCVEVVAVEAGGLLMWEVQVADKSIVVSAQLKVESTGKYEQVMEPVKVKAEMKEGSMSIAAAGVVEFTLDNSQSILNSKTVKFQLAFTPAGEDPTAGAAQPKT